MPQYEAGPADSRVAADEAYRLGVQIAEIAHRANKLGTHFATLAYLLALACAEADILAGAPMPGVKSPKDHHSLN
ncbi:MAG: hypothetical protein QOF14_911 [Hyphomicrobiales bacterium]|jgi:hypothetical protein|nr:hypothetical protein [Hyphomicrobiales bacterium]